MHLCSALTHHKHRLGLPWAIFLELHGAWHLLTGVSTYCFMALIEFLTSPDHVENPGIGFKFPARAVLEDILPTKSIDDSVHTNGSANGHANGHLDTGPKSKGA